MVVRGLEDLPDESVDGLLDYAAAPADEVALVLVHGGGPEGSGVLAKLRKLPAVTEVKSDEIKRGTCPASCRRSSLPTAPRSTADAPAFLVTAVGQDLRSLAAAAHQLTTTSPDEQISVDEVKRYFGGRAEATSFAVADAAFSGRRAGRARGAAVGPRRRHRHGPITSAFAGWPGRSRATSAPPAVREADLARELGVPPWKLKDVRDQSRSWTDAGSPRRSGPSPQPTPTSRAQAHDASYTLERLVLTVAGLRELPDGLRRTEAPDPAGRRSSGSTSGRRLRARRPSSRWPTCGWRPGSCG